ncbi:MAG: hypothetical protein ABIG56_04755 [Candidatus Omnitrophota bacterium]
MNPIKKLILFFFLSTASLSFFSAHAEVETAFWQTTKSQHFVIYSQEVPKGFVQRLISHAESYYNRIIDSLGFRRFDFWTWDNRAKIYLFKDSSSYQNETERDGWSGGMVHVGSRTIKTFVGQSGFFDSMLPHEMAHIIFREFIGEDKRLPLWIDEGVACSQEESMLDTRIEMAKSMIENSSYIDFDAFSKIGDSLSVDPQVFYSQAASIIAFLIERNGRDRFFDFSRRVRDGEDWTVALCKAYRFSDLKDMEEKWKRFMSQQ